MSTLQTRIVTLQPITSATPCSAANEDDLISRVIPQRLVGYIQLPLAAVVVSNSTPGADDTGSIWIKTDTSGRPEDIRHYYNGVWYRVENEQPGAVKWINTATITAAAYCAENPAWQPFSPAVTQTIGVAPNDVTLEAVEYIGLP